MNDIKRLNVNYESVTDRDIEAKTVFPDIIVHHRQSEDNLLVIEKKKRHRPTQEEDFQTKILENWKHSQAQITIISLVFFSLFHATKII